MQAHGVGLNFNSNCKKLTFSLLYRHANIGDAPSGHATNVGQCITVMLLRFLHLRNCGRSAMAGHTEATLLHPQGNQHNLAQVSRHHPHPKFTNPTCCNNNV